MFQERQIVEDIIREQEEAIKKINSGQVVSVSFGDSVFDFRSTQSSTLMGTRPNSGAVMKKGEKGKIKLLMASWLDTRMNRWNYLVFLRYQRGILEQRHPLHASTDFALSTIIN